MGTEMPPPPNFLRWPLIALAVTIACLIFVSMFAEWWGVLIIAVMGVAPSLALVYFGLKWRRDSLRFRSALGIQEGGDDV